MFGARKVWLALNREGIGVARCTVERLTAELGLTGEPFGPVGPHAAVLGKPAMPRRLSDLQVSAHLVEFPAGPQGSSYDHALAEPINGLYKTELSNHANRGGPSRRSNWATAEWVDWFNHRRLYEYCGEIPPVELETAHYVSTAAEN